MKIADSTILLSGKHQAVQRDQHQESLKWWDRRSPGSVAGGKTPSGRKSQEKAALKELARAVKVSLAEQAKIKKRETGGLDGQKADQGGDKVEADLNLRILKALIEKMYGKKIKTVDPDRLAAEIESAGDQPAPGGDPAAPPPEDGRQQSPDQGWGLIYQTSQTRYEYESFSFSAQGNITTADGRTIDFSLSLSMERETFTSQQLTLRAGDALKDPLVLNFTDRSVGLTSSQFTFDLDMDGQDESINFVAPGSGFLVLDKNGDQRVNDGSELFGPATGNGIRELAVYDDDNNGWIDENDAVFDRLSVWTRGADGSDNLTSLARAGVGALYLGQAATPFALQSSAGVRQGQLASTGLFLYEDGRAGTMQDVDLVA